MKTPIVNWSVATVALATALMFVGASSHAQAGPPDVDVTQIKPPPRDVKDILRVLESSKSTPRKSSGRARSSPSRPQRQMPALKR